MADTAATREPERSEPPLPPGPDGLPILGNTLDLVREPLGFLERAASYGDVVSYRVAGQRFTAVFDPDCIEQVLVADHDRFRRWDGSEWGGLFGEFGQQGVLFTEGEQWRRQRRVLRDAFTVERVESYADAMVDAAVSAAADWESDERIAADEATSALTLRILTDTLFDLDMTGRGDVVRRAAAAMNERASVRNLSTFLPMWVPTPRNRRAQRAMNDFGTLLDELVAERRRAPGDSDDLLSILLEAAADDDASLTEREIRDQLVTFLFAGHETTALALTYALYELAQAPAVVERLREELSAATGGDDPTVSDLPAMPFTERVVTETLRLYPPAYALFREALADAELGGYRIPEGSKLTLPQIRVHRDERWYDDPETFRPNRWAEGLADEIPDYAYFPFGGGPRHCIGMRMARLELRLVLPVLLSRMDFDLVGPESLSFTAGVTLQPAETVELRVEKR